MKKLEKNFHWWKTKKGMYVRSSETRVISVRICGGYQMAGKKQNLAPMWKQLMKDVGIEEPSSFLDHVYFRCTQRERKPSEKKLDNTQKCSSHLFLLEQLRTYQKGTNTAQKLHRSSTTWKDMLDNALSDIAKWQIRRQNNYTKFSGSCLDDHQIKNENWKIMANCQKCAPVLF